MASATRSRSTSPWAASAGEHGDHDVAVVDLEVAAQRLAGVGAAEAVGAERHEAGGRARTGDLLGHDLHEVGDGDDRALARRASSVGHERHARRLRGVQAVPALDRQRLLAQRLVATWPTTARRRRRSARPARPPRPRAAPCAGRENSTVACFAACRRRRPPVQAAHDALVDASARVGHAPASGSSRCRASGSRRRPSPACRARTCGRMPSLDDDAPSRTRTPGRRPGTGGTVEASTQQWPSWCWRPSPSSVVRPAVAPSRKPRARASAAGQMRSPTRWKPNIE